MQYFLCFYQMYYISIFHSNMSYLIYKEIKLVQVVNIGGKRARLYINVAHV